MPYYLAPYIGTGTNSDPFRPRGSDQAGWGAIDLRADFAQVTGRCLLWLPVPDADFALTELATVPTESLSVPRRQGLESVLGVTLTQTRFQQIVEELLLTHARADGTRWKPLRPMRDGLYRIYLGGLLSEWRPGSVGASISENWNCADSTSITCQLTWVEFLRAGNGQLLSSQVRVTGPSFADYGARAGSSLDSDDHESEVVVTAINRVSGVTGAGPICRKAADSAVTFYAMKMRVTATANGFRLEKYVASAVTNLGDNTQDWVAGDLILVRADGSTISGRVNGTELLTTTDTSIVDNLQAGITCYNDDSTSTNDMDTWAARDLAAAGATHPSWNWGGGGW